MSQLNGCPNPDCNDPNCPAGHEGAAGLSGLAGLLAGGGLPPLDKMMEMLTGKREKKKERADFLTKEEIARWNELKLLTNDVKEKMYKLDSLRKRFWADIEIRLNDFEGVLSIDTDTASIMREVKDGGK